MAVAHDAATEAHTTGNTGSVSQASFSFDITPVGTPAALVVPVYAMSATDHIAGGGLTADGVAMTRVPGGAAIDTAGEPARIDLFALFGADIPAGTLTIVVNRTNDAVGMTAHAITSTSATGLAELVGIVLLQNDGTIAQQNVDDGSPGTNSVRYAAGYYGRSGIAAGAASTSLVGMNMRAGSASVLSVRETTAGQGSRAVGFTNGTSDDRAVVHWAIREVAAAAAGIPIKRRDQLVTPLLMAPPVGWARQAGLYVPAYAAA